MSKSLHERRSLVDHDHQELSVRKQCSLLTVHRSGLYYQPKKVSALNLELSGWI